MKEFRAGTGGRFTYTDDILNLQELALSIVEIFSGCQNFVISGCDRVDGNLTAGYVWINGKIRYFSGATSVSSPYYIYETNSNESVAYANNANGIGRVKYLCVGGSDIPIEADPVTGQVPQYITLTPTSVPRIQDKFFGRYALLLDPTSNSQTIKKTLNMTGSLNTVGSISSQSALVAQNASNSYTCKTIVNTDGSVSIGSYSNDTLQTEISIDTAGSILFKKGSTLLFKISAAGVTEYSIISGTAGSFGNLYLSTNSFNNTVDATDTGSVDINSFGYNKGITKFRNFRIGDGKQISDPIFQINGAGRNIYANGSLDIKNAGLGIRLSNKSYAKDNVLLTNMFSWTDKDNAFMAGIGYNSSTTNEFSISNTMGDISITPLTALNIVGVLKISGTPISSIYSTKQETSNGLNLKVDKVEGKVLSSNDFTNELKAKLDGLTQGSLDTDGDGFVSAAEVKVELNKMLQKGSNLLDLSNVATARTNLSVFSKTESDSRYLQISNVLSELVYISDQEKTGKTAEEIAALLDAKEAAVRTKIKAEKLGSADLKLSKSNNLSDLPDKTTARTNLGVYSTTRVDELLAAKLNANQAYSGVVFTSEMNAKLQSIVAGNFAYVDGEGVSYTQKEGYASISQVVTELAKKADKLLTGYSSTDKDAIANNIAVYSKTQADGKFGIVASSWQDYINYLVNQYRTADPNKTVLDATNEAQSLLRSKIGAASATSVDNCVKKNSLLSDLTVTTEADKQAICNKIGAAYSQSYQPKINDTGWKKLEGSNALFARQIGNIVCIQGTINTSNILIEGNVKVLGTLPNEIQSPAYPVEFNRSEISTSDVNRGVAYRLDSGSRKIVVADQYGAVGWNTSFTMTYMV